MALHPEIQPIVDLVNAGAAEAPPLAEQTPQMRRDGYHGLVAFVPAGPEMETVSDEHVAGQVADIPVRIYSPVGREPGAGGVTVFYHGGGWCIGDLDTHDEVCRQIAHQSGSVVVSVDYRLAPEAVFPAAVDDAWDALGWVRTEAARLVGSSEREPASIPLAVCGDSAGANLAAVMAVMSRDASLPLAAQLLVYPAVDFRDPSLYPSQSENAEGYVLTREGMDWFESQYEPDVQDWRASVITADSHADLAPALIITAEYDPLRDEGEAYAKVLEAAGVPVSTRRYDGMVHIFFQLGPLVGPAAEAVAQVAVEAKKALS